MTLDKIELNTNYLIVKININDTLACRLYEIGLINGSIIQKVLISPDGKFCAYLLNNSIVALRENITRKIQVERMI